ncbi:MAG: hypothetical protein KME16_24885 [Scytolyngbya sp. HA4215-MV1]|jgi:hypothetical protein|nr:hypothetical protein [Scytolyngbya sp. HA4215-MV1]
MDHDESRSQPNVWDYKPWWCQPWSILFTGVSLTGGSWFLFNNWLLTLIVGTPLTFWMGFFLLVYPRLVQQSGLLDTVESSQEPYDG